MNEYEGMRRLCYGDESATFVPVCAKCGRFVKADPQVFTTPDGPKEPNATCRKCGRTAMIFEGYL